MTSEKDRNTDDDVTYRIRNVFHPDIFLYLISDSPHTKTARNCLSNTHDVYIDDIFYEDQDCGLPLLPKLTFYHIKLTLEIFLRLITVDQNTSRLVHQNS